MTDKPYELLMNIRDLMNFDIQQQLTDKDLMSIIKLCEPYWRDKQRENDVETADSLMLDRRYRGNDRKSGWNDAITHTIKAIKDSSTKGE